MKKLLVVISLFLFVGMSISPSTIGIIKEKTVLMNLGSRGYIQGLIDNSSDGDTIYVPSGIYYENIVINKSISLVGENEDTTIIDGNYSGDDVVTIVSDWVNISGFTIKNAGGLYAPGFGIIIESRYNTVSNNIITENPYYGIGSISGNNNTISGNIFTKNGIVIILSGNNNSITDNTFTNNWFIYIYYSSDDVITGNTMLDHGIFIQGNILEHWNTHVIDTSNTLNGKPIFYWKNQIGGTIPSGAGQVILANCTNAVVENQEINNDGIKLGFSFNCTIAGNNISKNNSYGIFLYNSSNNIITGNIISNSLWDGILLDGSSYNTVTGNNISNNSNGGICLSGNNNIITGNNISSNNRTGISLSGSSNNITSNNINSNNENGIYLWYSSGNNITSNNISNNNGIGLNLKENSDNNLIYHNNFIDNTYNAYDEDNNIWDDGKKGNYWSDYKEKYPNAKKKPLKGIWDTPYNITGGDNKDNFPLIKPFNKPRTRTITRNMITFNLLFYWFLERFPFLEILFNNLRRFLG